MIEAHPEPVAADIATLIQKNPQLFERAMLRAYTVVSSEQRKAKSSPDIIDLAVLEIASAHQWLLQATERTFNLSLAKARADFESVQEPEKSEKLAQCRKRMIACIQEELTQIVPVQKQAPKKPASSRTPSSQDRAITIGTETEQRIHQIITIKS